MGIMTFILKSPKRAKLVRASRAKKKHKRKSEPKQWRKVCVDRGRKRLGKVEKVTIANSPPCLH
jgi:hypothetical protein